jgi:hypothetical protein
MADDDDDFNDEEEGDLAPVRKESYVTCDGCDKKLYEGDSYWGNNQIGTYCEECAEAEIAQWWGVI